MIFFTADTHFYHKNVIDYCNRPFSHLEEMNEKMIERWNVRVGPEDTVFHLGDFSFGSKAKTKIVLGRLNGSIYLVRGNHDSSDTVKLFQARKEHSVIETITLPMAGKKVHLSHYPYAPKPGEVADDRYLERRLADAGDWLLHGHVHQHWKTRDRMINVGVDVWSFLPVSEEEILEIMCQKNP